jgi:hypothetical protein
LLDDTLLTHYESLWLSFIHKQIFKGYQLLRLWQEKECTPPQLKPYSQASKGFSWGVFSREQERLRNALGASFVFKEEMYIMTLDVQHGCTVLLQSAFV